ncbi:MAG: RNB domain-containing ribonuclease [Blastocatellia bacterium]
MSEKSSASAFEAEFQRIRDELDIPRAFAPDVLAEARQAARRVDALKTTPPGYQPLPDIPFVTIDPPESMDLDQAFFAAPRAAGYEVHYAIADVGFFVDHGGAIENEAWRRGLTLYSPNGKTPLYPAELSEGAASLLSGQSRPAIVFTFDLDARAAVRAAGVQRAIIRSRAKLSYQQVSEHLDAERGAAGTGALAGQEWAPVLRCLELIGRGRQKLEIERGGVSLRIPAQQVERWSMALSGYRLAFELSTPVEEWNAQISLMTGMAAAEMMRDKGAGLLRALDPPDPDRVRALRLTARALDVTWPDSMDYDDFVRGLDPARPLHAVLLHQAARVMGGARYVAFAGPASHRAAHSAIAAPYAHVTAPLRRLADRYALDLLVAEQVTESAADTLRQAPRVMSEAERLSRTLEKRLVDFAEAQLLRDRIGETFSAVILSLGPGGAEIQITEPPVRTIISLAALSGAADIPPVISANGTTLQTGDTELTTGQTLQLRLTAVNPERREIAFALADA